MASVGTAMRSDSVVANHALENLDGRVEIAQAHLLVARRGAQQRMARLEREALLQLIAGQLDLILIVIDAGAMVVENGRVGRIQLERAVELG